MTLATKDPGGLSWHAIAAVVAVLAIGAAVATWHGSLLIQIHGGLAEIRADLKTSLRTIDAASVERQALRGRLDDHDRRITTLEATALRSP